jgi:hypothetical protein
MKLLPTITIMFAFCAVGATHSQAQSSQPHPAETQDVQHTGAPADKTAEQRRYDPMAGREHLRGGIWDNALSKINPSDIDYGERLDAWRRIVIGETIESGTFWIAVMMGCFLLLAIAYIYWLHRDRAHRLDISANILTQISNSFLDARDHALDAIARHNQLADDYNALAERMAALEQQRGENLKRVRGSSQETTTEDVASGAEEPIIPVASTQQTLRSTDRPGSETDAQVRQRFANQINALQEKNKTLRNSLNEVLGQLEQARRQPSPVTGA